MQRDRIVFVTQTLGEKIGCGIGLIGKLLGESLIKSKRYNIEILYTDSEDDLEAYIKAKNPQAVIYNFHCMTTPWVQNLRLRKKYNDIVHIMLQHEMQQDLIDNYSPRNNFGFKYVVAADPTLRGNSHVFLVNRLAPPYKPKPYVDRGIPIIGFQGFGARYKGIHKIAERVQEEFDEAIIRLHIPFSFFTDHAGNEAHQRVAEVRAIIKKPGIKVEASHDLLSTQEIVEFLGENTINCYFYEPLPGAGLASSPDYALAAGRPIAVSKSSQLRNFMGLSPSICIEDNSLKDIISFGVEPLKRMHRAYSEEMVLQEYEQMLDHLLQVQKDRFRWDSFSWVALKKALRISSKS